MLLIITNRRDLASDYLILRLRERGIPFERLNTEEFGRASWVSIRIGQDYEQFEIQLESERVVTGDELDGVYFRQPIPPKLESRLPSHEETFAEEELLETLRSLWRMIPQKYWLNHPRNLWIAANKVEQLLAARASGLDIPDTLVSNHRPQIERFLGRSRQSFVAKAVKHGFVRCGNMVLLAGTQKLSASFVDHIDDYAPLPMTYQEEVEKGVDLRVIVVGEKIFTTAIHTPESFSSTVDWRTVQLHDKELPHERVSLPENVKQSCLQLLSRFDLNFASMDMIKDRSGRYVFLELNPNGQWAWIEQLTGYPIRDAIIDYLTS